MTVRHDATAVGVVIPARDEGGHLGACLDAVSRASRPLRRADVAVHVVLVLDRCVDSSALVAAGCARQWQSQRFEHPELTILSVDAGNVGAARAAGCNRLITTLGRRGGSLWLATTDADSVVPRHWLRHQLAVHRKGADAWVGTIEVKDTGVHRAEHLRAFRKAYRSWDGDEHPHVHGANLGFTARAYQRAGGFASLATGEDHNLVRRLLLSGAQVSRGSEVAVLTSDRVQGRSPNGFAATLAEARIG